MPIQQRKYKFYHLTPDGKRHYRVNTSCTVSNRPTVAKIYTTDNPEEQREILQKSFEFAWLKFEAYSGNKRWGGACLKDIKTLYHTTEDRKRRVKKPRLQEAA